MATVHLIAVHYKSSSEKESPTGFSVMEMPSERTLKNIPYDSIYSMIKAKPGAIEGIEIDNGVLRGSNGDFSRYTRVINGAWPKVGKIVILNKIGDKGFTVLDGGYVVKKFRESDTIKLSLICGIANGKLVKKGPSGSDVISAIKGSYIDIYPTPEPTIEAKPATSKPKQEEPKAKPEAKPNIAPIKPAIAEVKIPISNESGNLPESKAYTRQYIPEVTNDPNDTLTNRLRKAPDGTIYMAEPGDTSGISVAQMFNASISEIKRFKPFYGAALRVIPRIENTSIETIGVTIDKMYYNPNFLITLTVAEMTFILLHEICHIMMKHRIRGEGKNHDIWNIVCDLYINKALCDEFNISPGSGMAAGAGNGSVFKIECPENGCHSQAIDIKTDTPEKLYAEFNSDLQEQLNNQKQQNQQGQKQQGQQGQSQGQQGQNQQGQGQGQQGQGQQGQSQQGQGQGQQGQSQQGQGQQGQGQGQTQQGQRQQGQQGQGQGQGDGQGQNQQGQGQQGQGQQGQGQGQQGQGQGQQGQGQGQQGQGAYGIQSNNVVVDIRGTKVKVSLTAGDLKDDDDSKNESNESKKQRSDRILNRANTVFQQVLQSSSKCGSGKGNLGVCEEFVADALAPKVNWRALVQDRLVSLKSNERSLSHPDRRFVHQGLYVEGEYEEEERLEGLKMCIDTSGSMSDKDIAIAYAQIRQLIKMYEVQADIVYWDDGIQKIVSFDKMDPDDFKKCKAMGRGGTDPSCIFEEFSKKEYKYGLKVKPCLIIIFTDGFFSLPSKKYKTAFGADTVWVLCSEVSVPIEEFKPTFGKVAKFRNAF